MSFDSFLGALESDQWEQKPVDLDTFMYDPEYLGRTFAAGARIELSPIQRNIIEAGSQIYDLVTCVELYGEIQGKIMYDRGNYQSFLLMLGKGSGKDFMSKIIFAYIVHKLLCLKDPAAYFKRPSDDNIDLVNMALNSDQASRVFFTPLKKMVEKSSWFSARLVSPLSRALEFEKNVFIYSMHSSWEAAEGLNVIAAVLDEIDGFETEGYSQSMYDYLYQAMNSRFPKNGKVLCLSFPRSKEGWMYREYEEIVGKKNKIVHEFTHTYKYDESLEDGIPDNELVITWTEDEITGYNEPGWYALAAPTFRVNPSVSIENYRSALIRDHRRGATETMMRTFVNPPDHSNETFFKNYPLLEATFDKVNGYEHDTENIRIKADENIEYFVRVDLSKVSDRTVVCMGHVSKWVDVQIGGSIENDVQPYVVIDLFRVWEPTPARPVDNAEVVNFIFTLAKNFNLRMVTFDRWGSLDIMKHLDDRGVENERVSLGRSEYMEFRLAVQDHRLEGPEDERLLKELKNLIINKVGKVDHPQGKEHFNDISEGVCGVVASCVKYAEAEMEVDIVTMDDVKAEALQERERLARIEHEAVPKMDMPDDIKAFIAGLGGL